LRASDCARKKKEPGTMGEIPEGKGCRHFLIKYLRYTSGIIYWGRLNFAGKVKIVTRSKTKKR
jgi:hypothetical protein